MKEIWEPIPEYDGYYWASSLGRVISYKREKMDGLIVNQYSHWRDKYMYANLNNVTKAVHRLVLSAFTDGSSKLTCNHIDGDKLNNNIKNLEWMTQKENVEHSVLIGRHPVGSKSGMSKVDEDDVIFIREVYKSKWMGPTDIGRIFGIHRVTVHNICKLNIWKHVK
jgi:hypothetical protein